MKETGWYDKPGVRICEGKWQDFIYEIGQFDVIYVSNNIKKILNLFDQV